MIKLGDLYAPAMMLEKENDLPSLFGVQLFVVYFHAGITWGDSSLVSNILRGMDGVFEIYFQHRRIIIECNRSKPIEFIYQTES